MLKMFYNGSLAKALMHLFPEIDVDLSKFEYMPRTFCLFSLPFSFCYKTRERKKEKQSTNANQRDIGNRKRTGENFWTSLHPIADLTH